MLGWLQVTVPCLPKRYVKEGESWTATPRGDRLLMHDDPLHEGHSRATDATSPGTWRRPRLALMTVLHRTMPRHVACLHRRSARYGAGTQPSQPLQASELDHASRYGTWTGIKRVFVPTCMRSHHRLGTRRLLTKYRGVAAIGFDAQIDR